MADNKDRATLYSNLLRGIYALDGIDGEFVAALCRTVPFKPLAANWPPAGVLAQIPAKQVRAAKRAVQAAKSRISRHRRHFAYLVREDRVDDEGLDSTHGAYAELLDLREEQADAEAELALVAA